MKTAIVLLAIVAFASAARVVDPFAERFNSSTVVDVVEGIRDQMACGFPGLGIPPLAPLKIAHKEINIDTPALRLTGSVVNFGLNGLNDFDEVDMRVNSILGRVNFTFNFNNLSVDTSYDFQLMMKEADFTMNMVVAGSAKFAIKDMRVWGTMTYSLGVLSGKSKLKTLEVRIHIGDIESDIEGVNEVLAEVVKLVVNENEDLIAETIENAALPVVNSVLDDITLADLIDGISGDDDGTEKEACIPTPDE